MPNHVHLILVPSDADGLRAAPAKRRAWRDGVYTVIQTMIASLSQCKASSGSSGCVGSPW
jgi:hypothetical protein